MNDLILDELIPNPPEVPKFQPEDFYFYLSMVTMVMGIYLGIMKDKNYFDLFTMSVIFACTYNIIKEIKKKNGT